MDQSKVERVALLQAIEDFSGLWEILWELNGLDPDGEETAHIGGAIGAIKRLARDGYVEVFYCQEPYEEMLRVEDEELTNVLGDTRMWRGPEPDSRSVRIGATEAVSKAYFTGRLNLTSESPRQQGQS